MKKHTQTVEFLASGLITWVSKSGKTQEREYMRAGETIDAVVEDKGDDVELWVGGWSVLMPKNNLKVG